MRVDDRALRELYLRPFERAVEAGTWSIMSAYNAVDGVTMTENDLLESPLNSEWGFDGVVVSDWTAVRSLGAASASQDLAMPGPAPAWVELADAVRDGRVCEADLDRKVLRLLLLAERVGALNGTDPITPWPVDGPAFVREAAVQGTVLLRNSGVLPLDAATVRSIAVLGQHAREPRTQGGGSATVIPDRVISPLDALRAALPHADLRYEPGVDLHEGLTELPLSRIVNPTTGKPGLRVTFYDPDGVELFTEDRRSTALVWFGGDAPILASRTVVLETRYTPESSGEIQLGFAGANPGWLYVDEDLILDQAPTEPSNALGASILNPPSLTTTMAVNAGRPIAIRGEFSREVRTVIDGALSLTLGIEPEPTDPEVLIARAAEAAQDSQLAVIVVGTNSQVESEGHDRTNLDLPGRQNDLVRAVAATGTPTVVIVNAGSPVVLPWANEVAAIMQGYFGGQEFGHAIADVLTGAAEPGGRLPTTWPAALCDVPVTEVQPVNGQLVYREGLHIGYRAWLRNSVEPAFPFGHGLGYTTWTWTRARRHSDTLEVTRTNTGTRPGKQVVQVYAERPLSTVERPVRWLVGFAAVRAQPGESVTATIPVPPRRLAHWTGEWVVEPGTYTLRAGASVADLSLSVEWEITG